MAIREVSKEEILKARNQKRPFGIWWSYKRELASGVVLYLFHLGGGMTIGLSRNAQEKTFFAEYNYWDVPTERAWTAAIGWDGEDEPDYWTRARMEGVMYYRRRPEGDPSREYKSD